MKILKTFVLVTICLFCSLSASAYDFKVGDIYYTIISNTDFTVAVTYGDSKYSGNISIPETVTYNEKTYSVTSIGSSAFNYCSDLTSVTIPNSVTSIRGQAFSGCKHLSSITIPESVTSIGYAAFADCWHLGSVTIPNSVTSIGSSAFNYCYVLTSVTIPNSVTSIGESAFSGCKHLSSITIPESVTSIGYAAFADCWHLGSVTIPNSVTSIGQSAFYGCSDLTSVTIPKSVTSIGDNAFSGCYGLTSIIVESGNPNYDSRENCNAIIETSTNKLIIGCKETIIPNSITSIGDEAFAGCSSLTSVTIPNSVTSIGNSVFYACSGLTSVTVYHETPLSINSNVFYYSVKDTLYIPAGTKELYQSAKGWKDFKNIIEMIPSEPEITIDANLLTNGLLFSHEQDEQSIQFSCNGDWTLSIANTTNGSSWCTASLTEGTKGDITVKFTVTENTNYEDRSVSVTIKSGSLSKTFTITQKSAEALLVTTNKYEMPQEGGTINVEVKSNLDYQIEIDKNCKSWISEITTRALTSYTHSFKIEANENEDKREGKIYVKSGDKVETIKVYQAEKSILILSQNEYEVSEMGETISVDIRSNVDYGIEMPNVDWISELSTRSASSYTLKFVVSPNETTDVRTAEIVFYDKNSDLQETLTVIQAESSATANEIIFASTVFKVQRTDGGVTIHSDKMIDLSIYDMNGLLLIRKRINGSEQISLPKGFYILSAENQNQKLIIK